MTITRYGTCPGVRTGENEVQAYLRQKAFYGPQRVTRVFFPGTLMGAESGSAQRARELILTHIPVTEDVVVSCKGVGTEFPLAVAELRARRVEEAIIAGVQPGKTWLIIHHEPEGDLSISEYNAKWNTAAPVLVAESGWLWPGTCHTGFWSRRVDADGVRVNDWRDWIPTSAAVQSLLRFVSVDLYPSAGRPTRSKPNYYEPPMFHKSPYGFGWELGFCGILDEMLEELRSEEWPDVSSSLEGGIAELNHSRPVSAEGWPTSFADTAGSGCAEWLDQVLAYAHGRYAWVTYFHKGGGDLMLRAPANEAAALKARIVSSYSEEEPVVEETPEQAYARGVDDGTMAERARMVGLLRPPLLTHAEATVSLGDALEVLQGSIESLSSVLDQLDPPPTPAAG